MKNALRAEILRWRDRANAESDLKFELRYLQNEIANLGRNVLPVIVSQRLEPVNQFEGSNVRVALTMPAIEACVEIPAHYLHTEDEELEIERAKLSVINHALDYLFRKFIGKPREAYVGDYREAELNRRLNLDSYESIGRAAFRDRVSVGD